MTAIKEIARKVGVSSHTVRKFIKAGYLKGEEENPLTVKIRQSLAAGHELSIAHLIALYLDTDGDIFDELGRYKAKAQAQIRALDDLERDAAPRDVYAYIQAAARNDNLATEIIAGWIKSDGVLGPLPVSHAWLGARLVFNSPNRVDDIAKLAQALFNVRREDSLAGWHRVESGRTIYARPKKGFDL